jgi:hypothetical protein
MNRTTILRLGAVAWTVVAVDAIVHLAVGDVVVPAGMAAILLAWGAIRGPMYLRARRAEATVSA